jgi:hypothetical protein
LVFGADGAKQRGLSHPIAQRLLGKLNVGLLQQSLDAIVAHHEHCEPILLHQMMAAPYR